MRATDRFSRPTSRLGHLVQRVWAPGQRHLDQLVHARRIADQANPHEQLDPTVYGRPETSVTDSIVRRIEDAFPGQRLTAVGFWGHARRTVQEALTVRVGFLMKDEGGVPSLATAELRLPPNTVTANGWETFAKWVLDQRVTLMRDARTGDWSWASARRFDVTGDPVQRLDEFLDASTRAVEVERGLLDRAAQLVHDQAMEQRMALGQPSPTAVPSRRRPGL